MEKYRQWEDEKNGINPFINAPRLKQRNISLKIVKYPLVVLGAIKASLVFLLYALFLIFHVIKHIFVLRHLIRRIEIAINKFFGFIFLLMISVYKFNQDNPTIKSNHTLKNLISSKKKTIVFSSQSNVIDWLNLMYRYSPRFLRIVKAAKELSGVNEDLLVSVSYLDLILYAMGIRIQTYNSREEMLKIKDSSSYYDIERALNHETYDSSLAPLVIFPEGTKTTREASLAIRSNIMDVIYSAFLEKRCNLFCEISYIKYTYFYPNNSTDKIGLKNLIELCSQLLNVVYIQTTIINIENFNLSIIDKSLLNKFKDKDYYYDSLIQENLTFTVFRNNSVSKTCLDHIDFLNFYEISAKSTQYTQSAKPK